LTLGNMRELGAQVDCLLPQRCLPTYALINVSGDPAET
jgi:hypothetical protein